MTPRLIYFPVSLYSSVLCPTTTEKTAMITVKTEMIDVRTVMTDVKSEEAEPGVRQETGKRGEETLTPEGASCKR